MSALDTALKVATGLGSSPAMLAYLRQTAGAESSGSATVKCSTSSATGMWQFTQNTWLAEMKAHGAQYGLGNLAAHIVYSVADKKYHVDNPKLEAQILGLRCDPTVSTQMMFEHTQANREGLRSALGHEPNAAELYLAHFAGLGGAKAVLQADPDTPISKLIPGAIGPNAGIKLNGKHFAQFTAADLIRWAHVRMDIDVGQMIAYDRETSHTPEEDADQAQKRVDAMHLLGMDDKLSGILKPFVLAVGFIMMILQKFNETTPSADYDDDSQSWVPSNESKVDTTQIYQGAYAQPPATPLPAPVVDNNHPQGVEHPAGMPVSPANTGKATSPQLELS